MKLSFWNDLTSVRSSAWLLYICIDVEVPILSQRNSIIRFPHDVLNNPHTTWELQKKAWKPSIPMRTMGNNYNPILRKKETSESSTQRNDSWILLEMA